MNNTKFPKFLYVREEVDASAFFFVADADPAAHGEFNSRVAVAKYQFVEQGEVTARAVYTGDDE